MGRVVYKINAFRSIVFTVFCTTAKKRTKENDNRYHKMQSLKKKTLQLQMMHLIYTFRDAKLENVNERSNEKVAHFKLSLSLSTFCLCVAHVEQKQRP